MERPSEHQQQPNRANREPLVAAGEIDCQVADLTATISATMPLKLAQWRLREFDQWIPIDGDGDAPIGQLVAHNSTGPLRLGYGAWRDLLLGCQFTNGQGELITAGGRTVKNVAGYDLTKFMVGQHGAFGQIVTVTCRTWRRPAGAVVAEFAPDDEILHRLMPSACRPQWAMRIEGALLCGYLGDEPTIEFYLRELPRYAPKIIQRRSEQDDIADRAERWRSMPPETGVLTRMTVPPSRIDELVRLADLRQWSADAAFGIVLCRDEQLEEAALRRAVDAVGGGLMFCRDGRWSHYPVSPAERQILLRLKQAYDPENRLVPLPLEV